MKILAIADRPRWAYETIAKALSKYLQMYDWEIRYADNIEFINENHARWDLIFALGWKWPKREIRTPKHKTISVMLSHRTLDGKSLEYWGEYMNKRYCVVGACNLRLLDMMAQHVDKMVYTPCGVDMGQFFQSRKSLSDPLTAGWAGRGDDYEFRGIPMMQEACEKAGWSFRMQSAKTNQIPHSEMVSFYHSIHVYLNMSLTEGGSCSVLEAASCGVPCITSDNGVARELITNGENGFIVERTPEALADALGKMTPDLCCTMGQAMRNRISNSWTWEHKAQQWKGLIDFAIEQGN